MIYLSLSVFLYIFFNVFDLLSGKIIGLFTTFIYTIYIYRLLLAMCYKDDDTHSDVEII